MASISWCAPSELMQGIKAYLERVDVVLDIGCGIRPQPYIRPTVHICCEPFGQYIEVLQAKISEREDGILVPLKATWAEAVRLFPPRSVDTVFLVDVIEHLDKKDGIELLAITEKVARRQVVVFTPLGFMPQCHPDGKDAWGLDGGAWQEHRSGWLPEDFDDSWKFFACETFHRTDNVGRVLDKPFGAFWAVKTHPGRARRRRAALVRALADSLRRRAG